MSQGDELALSPPVLLELLRKPQNSAVADEWEQLKSMLAVPAMNGETTEIACRIMVSLAEHAPNAHRIPVTDLLTAALAHQLGAGVIHADHDYGQIAQYGGIELPVIHCQVEATETPHREAARQRELKKEIAQLLHRMPADKAEAALEEFRASLAAGINASPIRRS